MKSKGKIFSMLAAILERPTPRTIEQVLQSVRFLEEASPEAKLHLEVFREFCLTNSLSGMEQVYGEAFAACCPYVGHHLFGDDRSRRLFTAKLREHNGPHMSSRDEAPDHIAQMLRSLMVQESIEEARDLISHCLIPAVRKMIPLCGHNGNPYQEVLHAVLLTLEAEENIVLTP